MKRYKFLLLATVAALMSGCYSDDTNLDYKTLDLPVIDNPTKDPALFVEGSIYELRQNEWLEITPAVSYRDMNDLSYRWVIDGKVVAQTRDLRWQCELEKSQVPCFFEVHRNSAACSEIFTFSIKLDEPEMGFLLLVEEQGGLRLDFLQATTGQPYTFTPVNNAAQHEPFPFTGERPRMREYWSCEGASVFGELMLLDDDPNNCISFDGHSLLPTLPLAKEFVEEHLPDNFRVKDFMHGGYVSYLLADDGRIFPRRGSRIYYTGRFMDLPVQYKGKQLKGERFISTKYSENFGLIYDTTEGSGRFLLVNFDYDAREGYDAEKAGQIVEFPASSNMSGITDYDLVDGWMVLNSNMRNFNKVARITMLFRSRADQKYYLREAAVKFTFNTGAVKFEEIFPEVYRELPDFGPNSVICVVRTDGEGAEMSPPVGYVYYTSASNPRKVLGKPRTSTDAPVEFHTFDSDVVAIDHGTYTRRSCYLFFATADGGLMTYITQGDYLDPQTNVATFEQERVVSTSRIEGKIRWAGWKYGKFASIV